MLFEHIEKRDLAEILEYTQNNIFRCSKLLILELLVLIKDYNQHKVPSIRNWLNNYSIAIQWAIMDPYKSKQALHVLVIKKAF